ncbi:unnamed protein product, partial [Ascophyllum nodosum]
MKIVATHRLKELKHLQAVEKLSIWRRDYGFDRLADGDVNWVHGPLPPTPEQITASLWADLKELRDVISLSGEDEFWQRTKSFMHEIGQGTVSFTVEEFTMIKRSVERRGRDAAYATVAPVDTTQYCS